MIPRLARDVEPAPVTDPVQGWLRVFLGLLRLPARQAEEIREELDGHLRERIRDLMVGGIDEHEAMRRAVAELGEAADVAARYRALRTDPRRRLIMHGTLFTVAGAALALSIAAFRGGQPPTDAADRGAETRKILLDALDRGGADSRREIVEDLLARTQGRGGDVPATELTRLLNLSRQGADQGGAAVYQAQALPPELAELKADWVLKNEDVSDAFEFLGKAVKLPVHVRWDLLKDSNLEPGVKLTMQAKQAGPEALLRAINELAGAHDGATVDLRVSDGVIEVAPRGYFDKRERELVSYDLSGIVAARMATYNEPREKVVPEVREVIAQFVNPEQWRDNGGELAEMTVVGDRLFVNEPARFHPQIRWILGQLPTGKAEAGHSRGTEPIMNKRYALKHAQAAEVLSAMRHMESISSIDFSECAVEAATNSLIINGTVSEQAKAGIAIECLDRPVKAESQRSEAGSGPGVVYLSGMVSRPGAYAMSDDGLTLRRLLIAAGGLPEGAQSVLVCGTEDGQCRVLQEIAAESLRRSAGPDPKLEKGQTVCVR